MSNKTNNFSINVLLTILFLATFIASGFIINSKIVFADTTSLTATASHIASTKTIIYGFNEPVQLISQSDGLAYPFTKDKFAIYKVDANDNYNLSSKANVDITSVSLSSNTLTITYSGSLTQSTNTNYIADAMGYNISDLNGNKIEKSKQVFTVAGNPQKVLGAETFHFTQFLKINSRGNDVIELQKFLNLNGYNCGLADGIYGPNTKNAVMKFQNANGLTSDGMVGIQTRGVLNK
ncbi:MAG: peptidoglycan-binding protein [Patescibacteria group bacterium]|nr:peptidoglycan-binding protein [Patescibacteria group bacterium]